MSDINGEQLVEEAADIVESENDPPMSLAEFIDEALEHQEYACSAPEYMLRAIEYFGKRTVTEHGEELQRWRFFDDPKNHGEHAVLGNTELLNEFVDALRRMAHGPSNKAKMFWFEGPTSTGKSELKRCLINGLREFSKTDEGKRFTLEWNVRGHDKYSGPGMTFGDQDAGDQEKYWYRSPVQANPLSVLPEDTRRRILYGEDAELNRWIPPNLDPFSQEAYDILEKEYEGDFEKITQPDHLKVVRYNLDIGDGIGVLQSEDQGRVEHKMVGEWMSGMLQKLDSRGRRNPQAMSYDGVLSQGNAGLTIIEDAAHHFETIARMLSVPEGDEVKIDRRNVMPVDTVLFIISNPDMEAELMKTAGSKNDHFRPVRRRLDQYRLLYLTTPSLEAELLHRLIVGYDTVWGDDDDKMSDAVHVDGVELAPHALEAMAFYDVMSRIADPENMSKIMKARIYDGQKVIVDGEEADNTEVRDDSDNEGKRGIMCTFTQEVIDDVKDEVKDDEDQANVVMPDDLLEAFPEALEDSTVFSPDEEREYTNYQSEVREYILQQQGEEVLSAILREHKVAEDEFEEYIENVYAWGTDEGDDDPDELQMQVFETEHLGNFDDSHYGLNTKVGVSQQVQEFRQDIISGVSSYLYEHRDENYEVSMEDVPLSEFPDLQELIEMNTWPDVAREFENLDPYRWTDPVEGTETERVKEATIENMVDMFGYSEESARRTSDVIFQEEIDRGAFDGIDIGPGGDN